VANALEGILDTFTTLDDNYSLLRAACRTQAARDQLAAKYSAAEAAYQKAANQVLSDDEATVAVLNTQLTSVNKQIQQAVAEMGDMSKVIDHITQALSLGAQLLAKAGV
jgi:chromosome segregation ATPase